MPVIHERDRVSGCQAWRAWYTKAHAIVQENNLYENVEQRLQITSSVLHCARTQQALAVRYSLDVMQQQAPGGSVEIRVAPWAAVKILPGPVSDPHNLMPPDTIELSPDVWLRLASGVTTWQDEQQAGHISAIETHEDVRNLLPLRLT